jgi:hypothetical protein
MVSKTIIRMSTEQKEIELLKTNVTDLSFFDGKDYNNLVSVLVLLYNYVA